MDRKSTSQQQRHEATTEWKRIIANLHDGYVPGDMANITGRLWRTATGSSAKAACIARKLCSGWRPFTHLLLYALVFALTDAGIVFILQMSVHTKRFAKYTMDFVEQMWLKQQFQFMMNFIIAALVYLTLLFLINRFWIATAVFIDVGSVAAVANHLKVMMRNEPIIPADLTFLNGNAGEIISFIPSGSEDFVHNCVIALIVITLVCVLFHILDDRKALLPTGRRILSTRREADEPGGATCRRHAASICVRILLTLTPVLCLGFLGSTLGATNSWTYTTAKEVFSDRPILWNSFEDSYTNGPLVTFTRLSYHKAMDKPENYSKETMQDLAERYTAEAAAINRNRSTNMTDSTVIMLLSESLSDPTRVPGVSFDNDPMPNIRALKGATTSGLMLSPGYGGGTANIEYQSLTGMSLANFNPSLAVPYQQLVPSQKWTPSFNQLWNAAYGVDGSEAIHPYYKGMYLRDTNYRKFGFSTFWTLQQPNVVTHQAKLGSSPYVSDEQTYRSILDQVHEQDGDDGNPQFLQVVTMQNHMPYTDWYPDNEFFDTDTSDLPDGERYLIDTYTKGVSITDQATADFLEQLDQIDRPITVIFYGDHLPGIYDTANAKKGTALKLHETDYFIWSNQASPSAGVKLPEDETAYTSSNYFMSLAAEHMGAKVSPFLAMLTDLRAEVPAMNSLIPDIGGIGEGRATYLDAQGKRIKTKAMSDKARKLLDDYALVQYDMTVGKGYLRDYGFTELPESH